MSLFVFLLEELIRGAIDALRVPELQATKKASLVSMVEEVKEEIEKDIEKTQKQEEELQTKLNGIQQNAPCLKLCRRKEKEAAFVCMMDQEAAVVFSKEQEADVVCREEDQVDAACLNTRCGEEEEGAVGVSPEQVPLTAANREDTVPLTAANREDTVPLTEAKVDTVDVSPERFP